MGIYELNTVKTQSITVIVYMKFFSSNSIWTNIEQLQVVQLLKLASSFCLSAILATTSTISFSFAGICWVIATPA